MRNILTFSPFKLPITSESSNPTDWFWNLFTVIPFPKPLYGSCTEQTPFYSSTSNDPHVYCKLWGVKYMQNLTQSCPGTIKRLFLLNPWSPKYHLFHGFRAIWISSYISFEKSRTGQVYRKRSNHSYRAPQNSCCYPAVVKSSSKSRLLTVHFTGKKLQSTLFQRSNVQSSSRAKASCLLLQGQPPCCF